MRAYIRKLHDHILEPQYSDVIARCSKCGNQYSANAGDYWMATNPKKQAIRCCGRICELVTRQVRYIPVVA